MEICGNTSNLSMLFCGDWGGGFSALRRVKRLRPEIKIIGVEPWMPCHVSIAESRTSRLSQVGLFADGLRCGKWVKKPSVCVSNMWMRSFWSVRMTLVLRLKMYLRIRDQFELVGALAIAAAKAHVEREQIQAQTLIAAAWCQHEL